MMHLILRDKVSKDTVVIKKIFLCLVVIKGVGLIPLAMAKTAEHTKSHQDM